MTVSGSHMQTIDPALVESLRARAARDPDVVQSGAERRTVAAAVERLLSAERHILSGDRRRALVEAVVDEAVGLGPLERLLRDGDITEIMVVGPMRVFVERSGRLEPVAACFTDESHLLHVIDRILAPLGRRVDEASPMVDARLPDGSRVNVVIRPLSLEGPVLTVRRFGGEPLSTDDLVRSGTCAEPVMDLLVGAIAARRNLLVVGGTGSGKTTTLAALAAHIPASERVVTIEDAAELRIDLPHVVRLESRPPSLEGRGAVPIRALVRNALRMRPDRIIVGEVRGGEALDMLAALTTGHSGSLSTLHASSTDDALARLQTLAMMGDVDLPYRAIGDQVASALDMVVFQARGADGARRVVEVAAVEPGSEGPRAVPLVRRRGERWVWAAGADSWVDRTRHAVGDAG